jgi:hypothetical protein
MKVIKLILTFFVLVGFGGLFGAPLLKSIMTNYNSPVGKVDKVIIPNKNLPIPPKLNKEEKQLSTKFIAYKRISIPQPTSPTLLINSKGQKRLVYNSTRYVTNLCGANKIPQYTDLVTAKHCRQSIVSDAPVLAKSGKTIELTKPVLGKALINVYHFNKKIRLSINITEVTSCKAIFTLPPFPDGSLRYIQQGDSGGGVIQLDPITKINNLVGVLSTGIYYPDEKKISFEKGLPISTIGSAVYRDCAKYEN